MRNLCQKLEYVSRMRDEPLDDEEGNREYRTDARRTDADGQADRMLDAWLEICH